MLAGDLRRIGYVDVERGQLGGRENEVVILLEEGLETAPDESMGDFGSSHVLAGEIQASLDFVFERVLEGLGVLLQQLRIIGSSSPGSKGAEGDFGWREIGLCLLNAAA